MESEKIWTGFGSKSVNLFHSYCIVGLRENALKQLFDFFKYLNQFDLRGNPDFHLEQFDALGVDDSRRIVFANGAKSFGLRKIFVLAFNSATREAQNSLLKITEEPSTGTHFFFVVPRISVLIPTFVSRLVVVESQNGNSKGADSWALDFLGAPKARRINMVKEINGKISDEEISREIVSEIMNKIEMEIWRKRKESKNKANTQIFEDILVLKKYLGAKSSSPKLILEHLALVLPVI